MRADLSMPDIRPVFVVGHPRSGTTLVQLLLTAHPSFSSGPETHFFVHVFDPFPGWQDGMLSAEQIEIAFKRLAGKPGIDLDEGFRGRIRAQAADGGIAPARFLHELMRHFAEQSGKASAPRWIEKTPRHVNHVPLILEMFPQGRVINMVRDPRDVASSPVRFLESRSETFRRQVCLERAESWNVMVGLSRGFEADERILNIRYEDIIADPEASLMHMMQFLGETYRAESLERFADNYDQIVLPKEEVRKHLLTAGEIVDRRGIWKKRMSAKEARIVELICEPLMREWGYKLDICAGMTEAQKAARLRADRRAVAVSFALYSARQWIADLPGKISGLPRRIGRGLRRAARR